MGNSTTVKKEIIVNIGVKELVSLSENYDAAPWLWLIHLSPLKYPTGFTMPDGTAGNCREGWFAAAGDFNIDWENQVAIIYWVKGTTPDADMFVTMSYNIFVKTGDTLALPMDLQTYQTDHGIIAKYEGRLESETTFSQSCEDILNGQLGITSMQLNLENNDSFYNGFASENVSFVGGKVTAWMIFDDSKMGKIALMQGYTKGASFTGSLLAIGISEAVTALKEKALWSSPKYSTITYAAFPDAPYTNFGAPMPMVLGRASGYKMRSVNKSRKLSYGAGAYSTNDIFEAFEPDPSDDILLKQVSKFGTYRDYTGCITCGPILAKDTTLGGPYNYNDMVILVNERTTVDVADHGMRVEIYVASDIMFYSQGMILEFSTFGEFGIVESVNDIDMKIVVRSIGGNVSIHKHSSGTFAMKFKDHTLYTIYQGQVAYLSPNSDVLIVASNLDPTHYNRVLTVSIGYNENAGTGYIDNSILLSDGVSGEKWAFHSDATGLPPEQDYYIRVFPSQSVTANFISNVIANGLWSAGVDTGISIYGSLSGSPSLIELLVRMYDQCSVMSPPVDSTVLTPFMDAFEPILVSIFGFFFMGTDGKMGVRLFEKYPYGSVTHDIKESQIEMDTIDCDLDFSECAYSVVTKNPLLIASKTEVTTNLSGLLHGKKQHSEDSVLLSDTLRKSVAERKAKYLSKPIKRYRFALINCGYDIVLGDMISTRFTESKKWLGSDYQIELFVVKVEKSVDSIVVTAIENNFLEVIYGV